MKTIIFKSEKKAKVYEIRSDKNQSVYKKNELIATIKTDDIYTILNDQQNEVTATEIKVN